MENSEPNRDRLRPRIGGHRGQVSPQRVPALRTALLIRLGQSFNRGARVTASLLGTSGHGRRRTDVGDPGPQARRCVVKARVVQMGRQGVAAARRHLDYIVREGVEPDGSKGELFGDREDVRAELHAELEGEKHQFRLIVSPEDRGIDLRSFTRALMRQIHVDLGRDLIWGAVQHHDTDNPHAHLVIRGVDRQGREVRMDRDYISNVIRWRAQTVATNELGHRSDYAIKRQRDREVDQERFTSLDRELERRSKGTISLSAFKGLPSDRRARLVGRLRVLEQLALARRHSPGTWALVDGWQQSLRGLSERGDIIKRLHAATAGRGLTSRYRVIDGRSEQAPVTGVLRRKGLHDEQRGDMYAIVEDPEGGAHYVRINAATADRVKEGAIVRVASVRDNWTKPIDAAIVAFAAEHGGIYDPKAHVAALTASPATDRGRRVEPSDLVEASRRRLEWLGRQKLAAPLADGRWRVPNDLPGQLVARDGTHPRWRVSLETIATSLRADVTRRGPTWLDRLPTTGTAPFGFGAQVQQAITARGEFIRNLRLPDSPGSQIDRLTELATQDAGKRLATARGLTFIAEMPAGFRGVVVSCGAGPDPEGLAVIDERSRRLAILPARSGLADLKGHVVEMVRRPDGSLVLQRRDLAKED